MTVREGNPAMNRTKRVLLIGAAACAVFFAAAVPGIGQASPARATAPSLGTAANFAVLAGSTVTNTGATAVGGDLGVSPGTAVTGFPPGTVSGTIHAGDAVAAQAQHDAAVAYNSLAGQACDSNLTGQDLGGKTLIPGVYCFDSSAQLTGTLTLDGQGNSNAVFIFKIGSTLTTASGASVLLINGASSCNVFFQVGSSAILGTNTMFAGNILALTSTTLNTGATINGRALASNGAVTLDTNTISNQCVQSPIATATTTATSPVATVPATTTATSPVATVPATTVPLPSATTTAVPTPTSTASATPTNTAVPTPTSTVAVTPTNTAVPTPTSTVAVTPTNTAVPTPTSTASATPTNTAVPTPTSTVAVTPTDTAAATLTSTVAATATNTAAATLTSTVAATATNTAAATAISTGVGSATATPTPTHRPRPTRSPTPTATATPTRVVNHPPFVSHHPSPPRNTVPPLIPHTGAGGTSFFSAPRLVAPRGAAPTKGLQTRDSSPQPTGLATLPRTGGGAAGGTPTSPLVPLAVLGAIAIAVGRRVMRVTRR